MIEMIEDLLSKRSSDNELSRKDIDASKLLRRNVKVLKKMADKEGLSIRDLVKLLQNEQ
jgi:hypothetical protein